MVSTEVNMFNFNITFIILQCNITSNDQCFSLTFQLLHFQQKGINLQKKTNKKTIQNKTKQKQKQNRQL